MTLQSLTSQRGNHKSPVAITAERGNYKGADGITVERSDYNPAPIIVTPAQPLDIAAYWEAMPLSAMTFNTWFLLVPDYRTDD